MFWILPITLLIIFELIADIFAKEYALNGKWYLLLGAVLGYVVAVLFWLWGLRSGSGLARGTIIFAVSSAVIAIILGVYFYHETTNKLQIVGLVLGVLSIILILWE